MPDVGSWRLKRLWIGHLGLRQRGMLPDMKQRWRGWRPMWWEMPEHRFGPSSACLNCFRGRPAEGGV